MTFDISQQDFLLKYNINVLDYEKTKLLWEDLIEIAKDWINQVASYKGKIREVTNLLYDCKAIHSIRYRCKDAEHLVDKIIRKKILFPERSFTLQNYRQEIKDLGGIRILHLYKHQNLDIHKFIVSKNEFQLDERIAYLRRQEEDSEARKLQDLGFEIRVQKTTEAIYSSLHYIFDESKAGQHFYFEIQVRTIFEEGWAEIDHHYNYPHKTECQEMRDAIENLNHAVFLCNSLASTVYHLSLTDEFNNQATPLTISPELYTSAKELCIAKNYATTQLLQLELGIPYTLAHQIISQMQDEHFVSFAEGANTPRVIFEE
jgi:putative GTP pyrophosphokinase